MEADRRGTGTGPSRDFPNGFPGSKALKGESVGRAGLSADQAARISFAAPLPRRQLAAVLPSTASPGPGGNAESLETQTLPQDSCLLLQILHSRGEITVLPPADLSPQIPRLDLTSAIPIRGLVRHTAGQQLKPSAGFVQPCAKRMCRAKDLFMQG